ncbi:MAG: UDP-N-acetylmuramate dehydrogenase [Acidobacteriota bacterium]
MTLHNVALSAYTRFALGGPARILADVATPEELAAALDQAKASGDPHTLIGGGSNLIVSDEGFPGTVLRYTAVNLEISGAGIEVGAGTVLQHLVDASIAAGLEGLHTMTGIPGWVGGAVYGNAGAYGHSLHEFVESVRYFDGQQVREIGNAACEFRYRESIFKQRKDWTVLGATLRMPQSADPEKTAAEAARILKTRNEKFPPDMKCAGSIFKNLLLAELPAEVRSRVPASVVREGKVASAFFLERVGAKGLSQGGIRVADYHANLLYNTGEGKAAEVRELIDVLQQRVREEYGINLDPEVQFI